MDGFQISGLAVMALFYGSYFYKMRLQMKRGINANRLVAGKKPAYTKLVEAALLAITWSMAAVQLASVGLSGRLDTAFAGSGVRAAGIALALLGAALFIKAMKDMGSQWRAGVDSGRLPELVTGGIYRYSRNPAFVGFDLFYIGFALAFSNALQMLFTLLAVFTLHLQIREEEKFMEKAGGPEYREYCRKTARYFLL